MEGNGSSESSNTLESVDQIRQIIFGGQMRDYASRFDRLEQDLVRESADIRALMDQRLNALESMVRRELETLEQRRASSDNELSNNLNEQVALLVEQIRQHHSQLSNVLDQRFAELRHAKTDRATLAALLREVAQRIEPGESR